MSRGRLLERLYGLELPSQIKAVGLTRHNGQAAFLIVTDTSGDTALTAQAAELFPELGDVPVVTLEVPGRFRAAAYLPGAQADALTPEQEVLEPVVLGAQVQNGSADERLGGYGVGTLGAFARDAEGRTVLLSNNHVIAAENDARVGDEIFQAQRGRGRVVGTGQRGGARMRRWWGSGLRTVRAWEGGSRYAPAGLLDQQAETPLRGCSTSMKADMCAESC